MSTIDWQKGGAAFRRIAAGEIKLEAATIAELARIDQLFTTALETLALEEPAPTLEIAYFGHRFRYRGDRHRATNEFYAAWDRVWRTAHARRATSVPELAAKAGMVWRVEEYYRRPPEQTFPADYLVQSLCQDAFALAQRERRGDRF